MEYSILTIGLSNEIDPARHVVEVRGKSVSLRPREFSLLLYFMKNPNYVNTPGEWRVAIIKVFPARLPFYEKPSKQINRLRDISKQFLVSVIASLRTVTKLAMIVGIL